MSAWRRRARPVLGDERGTSLMEVVVATLVVSVAIALALPLVSTSQRTFGGQAQRSEANDQAALVLAQVERDVRSGNVVIPPAPVDGLAGAEVKVFTQVGGPGSCVHYRVVDGELLRRQRAPGDGIAWPSQWQTIATGVENAVTAPPLAPFVSSADDRTLDVQFVVRRAPEAAATVTVQTSVTGRNTKSHATPFSGAQCT